MEAMVRHNFSKNEAIEFFNNLKRAQDGRRRAGLPGNLLVEAAATLERMHDEAGNCWHDPDELHSTLVEQYIKAGFPAHLGMSVEDYAASMPHPPALPKDLKQCDWLVLCDPRVPMEVNSNVDKPAWAQQGVDAEAVPYWFLCQVIDMERHGDVNPQLLPVHARAMVICSKNMTWSFPLAMRPTRSKVMGVVPGFRVVQCGYLPKARTLAFHPDLMPPTVLEEPLRGYASL